MNTQNNRILLDHFQSDSSQQNKINEKIIEEISQGALQIPSTARPFIKHKTQQPHSFQMQLLEKVRNSKQKTLEELNELESKELQLKNAIREISRSKSPEKSEYTTEQKHKIKQILKSKRKKEETFRKKNEELMKKYLEEINQQKEIKKASLERMRQEHHKSAQKHLLELQNQQKNRKQSNDQSIRRMKDLRAKKYLFKVKQRDDERMRKQQEKITELQLNSIRERFKLDLESIKEHSKRVRTFESQREAERREKLKQKSQYWKKSFVKFDQSHFHKLLQEEENEKKAQNEMKQKRSKVFQEKIKQFSCYVRQNFQQKRKESPPPTTSQSKKSSVPALTVFERNRIGNQNLIIAKKMKREGEIIETQTRTEPQIIKYKNYLNEKSRPEKKNKTTDKLNKIMQSSSLMSNYECLSEAKELVAQIEHKSKKNRDAKIIESIKHKLSILKALQ